MNVEEMLISNGPLGLLLVAVFRWFIRDIRKMHNDLVAAIQDSTAAFRAATKQPTKTDDDDDGAQSPILPIKKVAPALALFALLVLPGCGSIPAQVHSDMQFAYQAWQEDRRPALDNDRYAEMPEEQRALYMPQSRLTAREAFWQQALKTAAFAAGEHQADQPTGEPDNGNEAENGQEAGQEAGEEAGEEGDGDSDGTPDAKDHARSDLSGATGSRQASRRQDQRSAPDRADRRTGSAAGSARLRSRPNHTGRHARNHAELGTGHTERDSAQRGRSGTEHRQPFEERCRRRA